ncbi:MAG: response regulator receiver protein [Gammaproteobacteria bacterium]|nr:response regulator receiver protein [Gammaproteobacteria bacterium]
MKLRVYLVDDEALALERLTRLLEASGRVEIIGKTTEPEEAVAALTSDLPDVCFLDIQMPRSNGFEVLASLPRQPIVVFTTAYDRYALDAFAVNSVDYLLKPIEPEHLDRALTKVEQLRASAASSQHLQALLRSLTDSFRQNRPEYPDRIASRLGDRLRFLELARVTHFYAEEKMTFAVSEGKAYGVDHTIAQLEQRLDPKTFFRIHRGTLVNITWIKELSPLPGGGLNARLKDVQGTDLTVARDRTREFRARLNL